MFKHGVALVQEMTFVTTSVGGSTPSGTMKPVISGPVVTGTSDILLSYRHVCQQWGASKNGEWERKNILHIFSSR